MQRYLDTVILGLGLLFISFGSFLLYERNTKHPLAFVAYSAQVETVRPARLTISSIGVDLPIESANIVDQKWETSDSAISYLSTSPLAGTIGNSIYYGHNWANLLGDLDKVKVGDIITVTNNNGVAHDYTIHFVTEVTPDQSHIYNNTKDYRLTLYTCAGFLDSKRLVITAILNTPE